MQTEMMSLDALLMNAEEDEHESIFLNFQIRLAYQIKLYDIYGVEIFSDNPSNLRTSTVISLNNAPIIDEYFDDKECKTYFEVTWKTCVREDRNGLLF